MNKLFFKLPPLLKNLAASSVAIYRSNQKFSSIFQEYYSCLISDNFSINIEEELYNFIRHAVQNTSFYHDYGFIELEEFSIITKDDIIKNNRTI